MKVYIKGIILGILSMLLAMCVVGIPYVSLGDFQLGWTLGMTVGVAGIILCARNKGRSKVTAGLVLSIIGVVFSLANLALSVAYVLGML